MNSLYGKGNGIVTGEGGMLSFQPGNALDNVGADIAGDGIRNNSSLAGKDNSLY